MRNASLQRLLEAARALPGDRDPVECRAPSLTSSPPGSSPCPDLPALRAGVGALLGELASRTEPALHHALSRAANAWDQADAVSIVDADLSARTAELTARWREAAVCGEPSARAAAVEALLALEAALGLVALVERRLATLIRLRLTGGGELLPEGRPFLDVAGALREASRGWA